MKKRIIMYVFMFCFILGCQSNPNDNLSHKTSITKNITVIFKNVPKFKNKISINPKVTIENNEPSITYYNGLKKIEFFPNINDTLIIIPICDFIVLKHNFNTISSIDYIFQKGDIIEITYKNEIPTATLIEGISKANDINYEHIWRNNMKKTLSYTPYEIFKYPYFSNELKNSNNIFSEAPKIKLENYVIAESNFKKEQLFLDSLKNESEISNIVYNFYSGKAKYLNLIMKVEQNENLETIEKEHFLPNSTSCTYSYYNDYLESFVKAKVENKVKIIRQSNGQIADYREVYDKVSEIKNISQQNKDLILIKYLELIGSSFDTNDFLRYLKKAKNEISDTILLNEISARFLLDNLINTNTKKELFLLNKEKKKNTLEDLIRNNKGKLVYVDFWASWCSPCRATMQSSKRLRTSYKDIIFVYISIDKDFKEWKKASNYEELNNYEYSFILINESKSSLLKNIQLKSIPRYLLFNKEGQLINSNAPNPDSKELIEIINKNL